MTRMTQIHYLYKLITQIHYLYKLIICHLKL